MKGEANPLPGEKKVPFCSERRLQLLEGALLLIASVSSPLVVPRLGRVLGGHLVALVVAVIPRGGVLVTANAITAGRLVDATVSGDALNVLVLGGGDGHGGRRDAAGCDDRRNPVDGAGRGLSRDLASADRTCLAHGADVGFIPGVANLV